MSDRIARVISLAKEVKKLAKVFQSPEDLRKYLAEHPKSDPSRHSVSHAGISKQRDRQVEDVKGQAGLKKRLRKLKEEKERRRKRTQVGLK